jgi:hypothetical protein
MFFDQLDDRNIIVQSNLTFEELAEPARPVPAGSAALKRYFFVQAPTGMIQICFLTVSTIET